MIVVDDEVGQEEQGPRKPPKVNVTTSLFVLIWVGTLIRIADVPCPETISPTEVVQLRVKASSWDRRFIKAETETVSPAAIERFVAFMSRTGQSKQSHEIWRHVSRRRGRLSARYFNSFVAGQ